MIEGARHSSTAAHVRRPYVLIVDDVLDNREAHATYFEDAGLRVAQARDGLEALATIAHETPDVVIMDLAMPRLDGWATTEMLKADPSTSGIVIIVVTAFSAPEDERRARDAGADAFCAKPCGPDALLVLIAKHLRARLH